MPLVHFYYRSDPVVAATRSALSSPLSSVISSPPFSGSGENSEMRGGSSRRDSHAERPPLSIFTDARTTATVDVFGVAG
ncbi:hypothetical protein DQ04_11591000 [Trypanosoma grayi]|uniref:hypothetical protein n=1 Tax=Trypanosoma grayi TaxID=71804 RepID=UPI0004F4B084|nr:hypothetical protein DQ04_11591000 [Trypanosoma grayi]KEG06933.1 hypothetical protein DQ04_11591000 [Trypanosoma grayi]